MAISPKSLANIEAHKFKPGQSGNPRGRPKNRVVPLVKLVVSKKRLKEVNGFTDAEINFMERTLLAMTLAELQALAKTDNIPAYMKGKAIAIISDMKNGKTDTIEKLRERQYGKAVERVELTGKDGAPLMDAPQTMTQEEALAYLQQLEEEY